MPPFKASLPISCSHGYFFKIWALHLFQLDFTVGFPHACLFMFFEYVNFLGKGVPCISVKGLNFASFSSSSVSSSSSLSPLPAVESQGYKFPGRAKPGGGCGIELSYLTKGGSGALPAPGFSWPSLSIFLPGACLGLV
ncbi:hypothetical protein H1C71_018971 [Ictidomys tridecemlineatus]|nr:hypothetical protein H1C71_018971 [Ictidomys tridecemlineatus]